MVRKDIRKKENNYLSDTEETKAGRKIDERGR